jgi:hypothetical protein
MADSILYYVDGEDAVTSTLTLSDVAFKQLRAVVYSLFAGWDVPDFGTLLDNVEYSDPDALTTDSFILADDSRLGHAVRFERTQYGYMPRLTPNPRATVSIVASVADYASFLVGY